jgi:hypothetical protein
MSSYNFTIPATTKEITQTCRTLPILIIFLVYILPLCLSVSLSLCLSHPKSLSADSCPCLFSSIGSKMWPRYIIRTSSACCFWIYPRLHLLFPICRVTATTQQTY